MDWPQDQQRSQGDVAYVDSILQHLQRQYKNGIRPSVDGENLIRIQRDGMLTVDLLYQLYRRVTEEGYGQ